MDKLETDLRSRFKDTYVDEALSRFEELRQAWEAMKETFSDKVLLGATVGEDRILMGHRWSLYGYSKLDGLYEIVGIKKRRDGEIEVTVQKVLDTKVSEAQSNTHHLNLMEMYQHPNNKPFDPYNEIVDEIWYEYVK